MNGEAARKREGFTLVELLVVIGIIAVLLGILLPSLSQARQHAQQVKCASNMRQIAMGFMIYADANKGAMVPARPPNLGPANNLYFIGNGEFWRPRWYATLGASTGLHVYNKPSPLEADQNTQPIENEVFLCPSMPEARNPRHYIYGYNHQFLGNSRNKVGTPSGQINPIHFPVKIARIRAAAQTVMFADSMGTAAGKPASQRKGYRDAESVDPYALANHGFTLDPPRLTDQSDYCDDNYRADEHRSAPDPRHRGRANVAFIDGHVEAMKLEELGYVVHPDGSVAPRGDGAHNCFFSGDGTDKDPPSIY